jgi:hypothetical protein
MLFTASPLSAGWPACLSLTRLLDKPRVYTYYLMMHILHIVSK